MKTLFYALTILASITFTSCCACRQGSPKMGDLESAKWKLIELNGVAVNAEKAVELTFNGSEKMIYGKAPCNNFFASYANTKGIENNIIIGNAGVTRMLCPDSQVEDNFVRQITNIVTIKVEGDNILMLDKNGVLIAICAKVI